MFYLYVFKYFIQASLDYVTGIETYCYIMLQCIILFNHIALYCIILSYPIYLIILYYNTLYCFVTGCVVSHLTFPVAVVAPFQAHFWVRDLVGTLSLNSSSFWGFRFRILYGNPKKELPWGLWVCQCRVPPASEAPENILGPLLGQRPGRYPKSQ